MVAVEAVWLTSNTFCPPPPTPLPPPQVVAVKVAVGYAPEEGDEDEEEAMAALEVRRYKCVGGGHEGMVMLEVRAWMCSKAVRRRYMFTGEDLTI